jgi:hypothetical protein
MTSPEKMSLHIVTIKASYYIHFIVAVSDMLHISQALCD